MKNNIPKYFPYDKEIEDKIVKSTRFHNQPAVPK